MSNQMDHSDFSYIISILIGAAFLIYLLWAAIKKHPFDKRTVLMGLIGLVLVGMPLWTKIEFSVNEDGSLNTSLTTQHSETTQKTNSINPSIIPQQNNNDLLSASDLLSVPKETPFNLAQFNTSQVHRTENLIQVRDPNLEMWSTILDIDYQDLEYIVNLFSE